jgi:hypothetical protein
MGVEYPVALDPEYAVWRGFDNHYWPALYFVDARGQIRHHHFGEGEYEQSERRIQQLLEEAGAGGGGGAAAEVEADGVEAAADWGSLKSPETYLGYLRGENFASPEGAAAVARRAYSVPAHLPLNHWALAGEWTIGRESAVLSEAGGGVAYRFFARDLHLVMGPAGRDAVRFRVLIDGEPPGDAHGIDVDEDGNGTMSEPRLHQLVRQRSRIAERTFEIEFLDPGAEAYVFTFG